MKITTYLLIALLIAWIGSQAIPAFKSISETHHSQIEDILK